MGLLRALTLLLFALALGSAAEASLQSSRQAQPPKRSKELSFKGFSKARFAEHDALIQRLVAQFNKDKAGWTGASASQARQIADLKPAVIKALFLQESGGGLPGDLAAWRKDPGQVNLPGNWSKYKADLGLKEPKVPNTGTLEGNVKAAIQLLVRKGFGKSGRAPSARPTATFDGWRTALERYNGRSVITTNGKSYQVNYAERILERASRPSEAAPIPLPKPKPKPAAK